MKKKLFILALALLLGMGETGIASGNHSVENNVQSIESDKLAANISIDSMKRYNLEKSGFSISVPSFYEELPLDGQDKILRLKGTNNILSIQYKPVAKALTEDRIDKNDLENVRDSLFKRRVSGLKRRGFEIKKQENLMIDNQPAMNIVCYSPKYKGVVCSLYTIVTMQGFYELNNVEMTTNSKGYQNDILSQIVNSIKLTDIHAVRDNFKSFAISNYSYTYSLPSDCLSVDTSIAPDHVFLAGNNELLSGVMVQKLAEHPEYNYYPTSLANLSDKEQNVLNEQITKQLLNEMKKARNIKNEFTVVNGVPCVKSSFDDGPDHSIAYIFIKDGNFISFDYIFKSELSDQLMPVVEKSIRTIKL